MHTTKPKALVITKHLTKILSRRHFFGHSLNLKVHVLHLKQIVHFSVNLKCGFFQALSVDQNFRLFNRRVIIVVD